ncbi:ABC transporter permease [Nakamurella sp. GG22]
MSTFLDGLAVETRKARSSRVLWSTGLLLVFGLCGLAATMVLAAKSGNIQLLAKLGPQAASGDWTALLSGAAQITSAGGLLAFGVGASWLYGREFADGTVSGLFGLPVSRGRLAAAKLVVFAGWSLLISLMMTVGLLAVGLAIGLGAPDGAVFAGLGRQFALGVLTASIAVPAGWAASLGRGLLPGIAVAVGILVLAQVAVLADFASWVPFVAPAMWALQPATSALTLLVVPSVPILFGVATVSLWGRLQLDR